MPNDTTNPMVITYGAFTVDLAAIPQASLIRLARGGLSHLLGSEMASKVAAYFAPDHEQAEARKAEDKNSKKAEFQKAAYDALLNGTLGASVSRGPSVDPVMTVVNRLAKNEIKAILAGQKLKFPSKADDTIELPDGSKVTGAQLVARRLDPNGSAGVDKKSGVSHLDRLTTEAKKIVAEQAKKNKKMLEQVEGNEL